MEVIAVRSYIGSTSSFFKVENGMILKSLHPALAEKDGYKFVVEKGILERLGEHPRIIKYNGVRDDAGIRGLLFIEASHGNLQTFIDQNNDSISLILREKWCRQVTEAINHLHCNGVIHSDLRLENCLVHESNGALDILLCDFGGSMCQDLGLDGRGLPDPPFWDLVWESTPGTDIFSLGSTFYTIMTGHWPYKSANPAGREEEEDMSQYEDRVIDLVKRRIYPDVEGVSGGIIMIYCWKKQYLTAADVLQDLRAESWDVTASRTKERDAEAGKILLDRDPDETNSAVP
ncbi:MAG: hypothetical protein Q9227_001419 [Pyrenula ochraceoflavens]